MKTKSIKAEIEELLVKDPRTRNSDELLYGIYISDKIGLISAVSFFIHFDNYRDKVASFETISRVRRKIQEQNPSLQASEEVKKAREELQGSFFDFVRGFDADV